MNYAADTIVSTVAVSVEIGDRHSRVAACYNSCKAVAPHPCGKDGKQYVFFVDPACFLRNRKLIAVNIFIILIRGFYAVIEADNGTGAVRNKQPALVLRISSTEGG